MTVDIDVPSMYRGRAINLWVEDAVVAAYLREVWADREIHILVAGGNEAVGAMAKHAEQHGYHSVFGLIDRDFGPTNYDDWRSPQKTFRTFRLPVLEVENLLLDFEAMAGCVLNDNNKTVEEIRNRIRHLATSLVPYMACRSVISSMRRLVTDEFLDHPKRNAVPDLDAAESLIITTPWFGRIVADTQNEIEPLAIRSQLDRFAAQYQDDLVTDERWKQTFSGKELLRDVASFLYQGVGIRGTQRDIEVTKAVARQQRQSNSVPSVIVELRRAIRLRLGLQMPLEENDLSTSTPTNN